MSTGIIVTIYVLWVILIVFLGEKWIRQIIKDKGGFSDYIFPTIAIIMGILAPFMSTLSFAKSYIKSFFIKKKTK